MVVIGGGGDGDVMLAMTAPPIFNRGSHRRSARIKALALGRWRQDKAQEDRAKKRRKTMAPREGENDGAGKRWRNHAALCIPGPRP